MTVFVDTGLFYALQNQRAQRHAAARAAFSIVYRGRYGRVYTSDYVFDEAVTLARSRSGRLDDAIAVGNRILGIDRYPDAIELLFVTEETVRSAYGSFERYDDHPLSFTDATTVALMDEHDIDRLLSFDDDFDGLVDRLDPGRLD